MSIEYEGHNVPISLRPKKPKFRLIEDDNNIKILIEVEMEGDIKQTYFEAREDTLETAVIDEIEQKMEEATRQRSMNAVNKIQKEFKTDVLGVNKYLRQSHHKLWKEVAKDWEEIFPNIDIDVDVDIKIRRTGLIR